MGGIVFRVEKSWRSWLNMHRASVCAKGSAPVNTDGGLQSEAPSRVYSPDLIWDGDLISPRGWAGRAGRAGLTSLTSTLRDQHLRVMRATASVTHFNFLLSPLLSILSREPFSVSPFHPPPLPAFFFFFAFLFLIPFSPQEAIWSKRCLVKGYEGMCALICCFALWAVKTCGQDRVGRKEEWRRGKEKQSGNELNCDLGKGHGGREKKLS